MDPATGGPPAVVMRLAAAQAAMGLDIHTLAYGLRDAAPRLAKSVARVPLIEQVRQHYLPDLTLLERLLPLNAKRECHRLTAGVDLVHVHGIWDHLVRVACSTAQRNGVPYVVTPHSPFALPDFGSLSAKNIKKRFAWAISYRSMLAGAKFIHALTEDERTQIDRLNLDVPVVVAPNGIFLEEIDPLPPPRTFRAAHPEIGDDPYVLFLGRLHAQKGLDILAPAFAKVLETIPRARLVVAGPDYGARQAFIGQINRLGVSSRVHVVGPLFDEQKYAAYVDAACFCLPSRQEGFSVAILEALACGCPAVISTSCHFEDVEKYGAGRVVDSQASSYVDSLQEFLSDPTARNKASTAGRAFVCSHYGWSRSAEIIMSQYLMTSGASLSSIHSSVP